MSVDIIVAPQNQSDVILQDLRNVAALDVTQGTDVAIGDVVTIVALFRNVIDDRPVLWKIRREVNAHFSQHPVIAARTLALIPDLYRDEIADLSTEDVAKIAVRWCAQEGASPKNEERAAESLDALVAACKKARSQASGVFLRTNPPPNAFEVAFSSLTGKSLEKYRRFFDKLDDAKKYEAHQKYNYYRKQGVEDSLASAYRDLTKTQTKAVNLKTDQRAIHRHILQRVKKYCKTPCPTSGSPDAPITLIMLTFDIEYEGYIDFGFDTREDAISNIQWEEQTEGCLELSHWNEAVQRLTDDELPLSVTLHDGKKKVLSPESGEDAFETCVGDMLRDTLIEARDAGAFAKLPLADPCYMLVGGTHTNYAWPVDLEFGAESLVNAGNTE